MVDVPIFPGLVLQIAANAVIVIAFVSLWGSALIIVLVVILVVVSDILGYPPENGPRF
jgi:hypothetical protein